MAPQLGLPRPDGGIDGARFPPLPVRPPPAVRCDRDGRWSSQAAHVSPVAIPPLLSPSRKGDGEVHSPPTIGWIRGRAIMQDRSCGDAGRYRKSTSCLPRAAAPNPAPVPWVNWYYAASGEQDRGVGSHTACLHRGAKGEGRSRNYSPEIYDQLREIVVSGPRCIAEIGRLGFLPAATIWCSEALPGPPGAGGGAPRMARARTGGASQRRYRPPRS